MRVLLIFLTSLCYGCTGLGMVRYSKPESNGVNEFYSIIEENVEHGYCKNNISTLCNKKLTKVFQYNLNGTVVAIQLHNWISSAWAFGFMGVPIIPFFGAKHGYGHHKLWLFSKSYLYITICIKRKNKESIISFSPCRTIVGLSDGKNVNPNCYAVSESHRLGYIKSFSHFQKISHCGSQSIWHKTIDNNQIVLFKQDNDRIYYILRYSLYCPSEMKSCVILPPITCNGRKYEIPPINFSPAKAIMYVPFTFP